MLGNKFAVVACAALGFVGLAAGCSSGTADDASQNAASQQQPLIWGTPQQSCAGGLTCAGKSCCDSPLVPGNTFPMGRGNGSDAYSQGGSDELPEHSATVSSFHLDAFEVTVGRFRKFLQAYDGTAPPDGSGANPNVAGTGWQSVWNANLLASSAALASAIKCSPTLQTWTDTPGARENDPVNCVNWYEAFAFCVWTGVDCPPKRNGNTRPPEARTIVFSHGEARTPTTRWQASPARDPTPVFCPTSLRWGAFRGGFEMGAERYGGQSLGVERRLVQVGLVHGRGAQLQ